MLQGGVWGLWGGGFLGILFQGAVWCGLMLPRGGVVDVIVFATPVAIGALVGLLRWPLWEQVAARVDQALQAQERIISAVWLAQQTASTPWQQLVVEEADQFVQGVAPERVVPWKCPRGLWGAVLTMVLLAVAWWSTHKWPYPRSFVPPAGPAHALSTSPVHRWRIPSELVTLEQAQWQALVEQTKNTPSLNRVAQALQQLLKQATRGEKSHDAWLRELAQWERQLEQMRPQPEESLREQLRFLAQREHLAPLSKQTPFSEQALRERWKEVQKGLQQQWQQTQISENWQEGSRVEQRSAERNRLQEEERRLKKKQMEQLGDEDTERRLQKVQKELERLEREQAQERREREELERALNKAMEEMRRGMEKLSPEARQAYEQALQKMKQSQERYQASQQQWQKVKVAIKVTKEVARQVGRSDSSSAKDASGQGHHDGTRSGSSLGTLRDFDSRAQGEKGAGPPSDSKADTPSSEPGSLRSEKEDSAEDEPTMLLREGGDQTLLFPLPQRESSSLGGSLPDSAPLPGKDHDPHLQDAETLLGGKGKATHVAGDKGSGPNRAQTIVHAARGGFASQAYRRVYQEYSAIHEAVIDQTHLPKDKQWYVRRYFELIRPRETRQPKEDKK